MQQVGRGCLWTLSATTSCRLSCGHCAATPLWAVVPSPASASCSHGHRDQVRWRGPERTGPREALELPEGHAVGSGPSREGLREVRLSPTEQ